MDHLQFSRPNRCPARHAHQSGVVLIISLIMLVIISLLASFSIRNATSNEAVAGNVRTTQMATQAAEFALRYCEEGVIKAFFSTTKTFTVSIRPWVPATALLPSPDDSPSPRWKNATMSLWDGPNSLLTTYANIGPTATTAPVNVIGTTTIGALTYQRPPECMIEAMRTVNSSLVATNTSTFLITARGFGPEVQAADPLVRARPIGSEVWLQSTIE